MCAAPTSAAEETVPPEVQSALSRAGWPAAAWLWEREAAGALEALAGGALGRARALLTTAARRAAEAMPAEDLRQVTAAANLAALDGDEATLAALAAHWAEGEAWVAALDARGGSRSSLFHLRLEAKHPGGYDRLGAERIARRWRDGTRLLAELQGRSRADAAAGASDALGRWSHTAARLGFGDERKIASAAGLLLGDTAA